ncbi:phosphonate C-P lyase system protein PhnH [Pseudonocardia kunmingensis]|uniref:Alpha-D-ribose 1-methylphosphonate 5-triphosphate synthase subunit PhnH n=1 Tax=Pseudonocardia kunmingensis TaxID=630975 RepID=A0A543D141_9PSEU|nr:phosphonate C-P lyase system protein PhnH [Pseudonocardia kunmingensis]TQM03070.1 alpha-D-ribose 1-methylphosphonate 5-triphosphate synthase subunit PhnH [Pseudonocardia kunmingensis]
MTAPALPALPVLPVLDPDTAQRAFRAVLDALARPGVPAALPPAGDVPAALLPVLALADLDTGVCVLGDTGGAWADALTTATSAPAAPLAAARLVAALRPLAAGELATVRTGSAAAPEDAALVALAVPDMNGGPALRLSGPGVPDTRTVAPRGLPPDLVTARSGAAFPAGADLLLVSPDGTVLGLPRTTVIEPEDEEV